MLIYILSIEDAAIKLLRATNRILFDLIQLNSMLRLNSRQNFFNFENSILRRVKYR